MRRVVIVGGGFGGVSVARQLARRSSREQVEIVLVEERSAHVYTPWLYEVATAMSPVHSEGFVRRARQRATIPFSQFPGFRGIRFIRAKVTNIAEDGSHVVLSGGTTLQADVIVLAVGSLTNDFGIPGAVTYAHPLKTPQEAEHIARELHRICTEVHERRTERATVAVVGAGANGVELIAEVAAVRNAFLRFLGDDPSRVRLVLCDAGAEPVGMFAPSVRKAVSKRLKKIGVEFFAKTAIRQVVPGEIQAEHSTLSFDLLIWSAGVKSRKEPQEVWNLPVNERGRIKVAQTLLVEGKKNMFALGDSAAREGEHPDPQSAQVASAQAPTVAKNILALFEGRPLSAFMRPTWQTLLAVGGSYGVGKIFGVPLKGKMAFWLRRLVDLKYFLSIFPAWHALVLWYRGVEAYGENDDPRS
jgi:NADH:ubiquinone reductase (H+-translocating)